MATPPPGAVTRLLRRLHAGERAALDPLLTIAYDELKRVAARHLRRERPDHTLQPTALVHEAFIRLTDQHQLQWIDRAHFFAIAAQAMRRVLIDHARSHAADKRGGAWRRVTLNEDSAIADAASVDLLSLNAALDALAALDAQQARIVELRFFAGLTNEEIAAVLGISESTVKRGWRLAKAWLFRRLSSDLSKFETL